MILPVERSFEMYIHCRGVHGLRMFAKPGMLPGRFTRRTRNSCVAPALAGRGVSLILAVCG